MTPILPQDAVFFLEWPTWARLAIVLGGLLVRPLTAASASLTYPSQVIILIAAFCVKLKNWRKDTRLEKKAAEEQMERGEMALVARPSDDIPFGIRALMEEPEVEGVWNSRTITPLHQQDRRQSDRSTSDLHGIDSDEHCWLSASSLRRNAELEPFTGSGPSVDPPPEASMPRKNGKRLVISYKGPYFPSESTMIGTDDDSVTHAKRSSPSRMQLRTITNRSSPGARKFVIGSRQKTAHRHPRVQVQPEADPLERMKAHRRFHAAESGQLLPRHRRHTDLVLTTPLAPSASVSEESDSASVRALSWPPGMSDMNLGRQLSRRAERMEGPKPVPLRVSVESLPTDRTPPSAWTNRTQARVDAKMPSSSNGSGSETTSKVSTHTPQSSISSTQTAATSPTGSVSIPNTRVRKINDEFEVLPAGTLEKGPPVKEFGLWPEQAPNIPPKPRKLQKRSRSSSESRRSSSESRRFSGEKFRLPIF